MSDANQPKKETVRIPLPPPPAGSGGRGARGDTVRINVAPAAPFPAPITSPAPIRPPTLVRPPAAAATTQADASATAMPSRPRVLPPPPRVLPPKATASTGVAPAPSDYAGSAAQAGPKQETARISTLPEAPAPPVRAKMTKTQPLLTTPAPLPAAIPRVQPPTRAAATDLVPIPLLWTACGISAVTLIIQIWNYFVS